MKNVLLVDDDKIFNFLNTRLLQSSGLAGEIHAAEDGMQALDLLNNYYMGARSLPDVILLDINMPVMDGFTFIEAFRKLRLPQAERVSIVIVTSSSDVKDMLKAKDLGVTRFLTKPLSEADLMAALHSNGS